MSIGSAVIVVQADTSGWTRELVRAINEGSQLAGAALVRNMDDAALRMQEALIRASEQSAAAMRAQLGQAGNGIRDDLGRAGEQAGGRLRGSLGSAFGALGGLAKTASAGAVAALAGIAVYGVKSAAQLEQTTTAFTSLLGSSKAADAQIRSLQQFAASTPFEFSDVAGYAQQFLAMHDSIGLAQNQLIPFLTTVGNLGAATGASTDAIRNAVTAIGQIGSTGKLTLDNLNQISSAFPGFSAAAALAKVRGESTAQVMQEISAGTLSAQEAIPQLVQGMQQFHGAAGAMVAQGKTLNGVLSTFADTVKINLTSSLQSSIPLIKNTLAQATPAIASALQQVGPAIANTIAALAPAVAPTITVLGRILAAFATTAAPLLTRLGPLFESIGSAVIALLHAIEPLVGFLGDVLSKVSVPLFNVLTTVLNAFAPVVQVLVDALQPVLPVIAQAFQAIGAALIQMAPVITLVAKVFADVLVQAINALAPVVPILAQAFADVAVALEPVIAALSGAFRTVIAALGPQLPKIAVALGQMAVAFAQVLVALTPLIPIIADIIVFLVRLGGPVLLTVIRGFTNFARFIAAAITGTIHVIESLGTTFHTLWRFMQQTWYTYGAPVWRWISKAAGDVWTVVSRVFKGIGDAFTAVGKVLQAVYNHTIGPILDTISSAIDSISASLDILSSRGGTVSGGFGTIPNTSRDRPNGHAAGGMVDDGVFLVGEDGPELGRKSGNQVEIFSTPRTRQILGDAGGGGSRLESLLARQNQLLVEQNNLLRAAPGATGAVLSDALNGVAARAQQRARTFPGGARA